VVEAASMPGSHCRLRLHAPAVAASVRPGQFVNVSPPLDSAPLRRPFGVYRTTDGADIDIVFKIVGRGTAALAEASVGDVLDIVGPLGNGFDLTGPLPETPILVAGGFGIAPLFPLALAIREKVCETYAFVGTEENLPLETSDSSVHASFVDPDVNLALKDFEDIGVVTRCASLRKRPGFFEGFVTDLLEALLHHPEPFGKAKLYACGPWAMMKKTAAIAAEHNLPCDVLLEERMGCGIGACMSCAVKVKSGGESGYARACVEGPVFDATVVDWDAK
jgi:dihydroorotate dehydrogenase electron transfer subunit